jgi:hypothetical protein
MGMGSRYSIEDHKKAALAYCMTGSSIKASDMTGIPSKTIRGWTARDWWPEVMREAKEKNQDKLDGVYTGIIERGTTQLIDRLDNGDYLIGKDGELTRRPMSGRDLVIAIGTIQDKRALIRREPTKIINNSAETLSLLAKKFEQIAMEDSKGTVIDVTDSIEIKDSTKH